MKSKNVLMLILFSILAVVLVSGCTDNSNHTYSVGTSTFQLPGTWEQTSNVNGSSISRARYEKSGITILISQYSDSANYDIDYQHLLNNYSTRQLEVSGVQVVVANTGTNKYLYFFQKNNKAYSVSIDGETEPNANKTINTIVTTIT